MKTIIKTNYFSRVFLYGLIFSLCIFPLSAKARQTSSKKDLCIVIDPGHGGIQSGTQRGTVEEKTLNLKIAQYLKEALEKYKGVTVSLTRDGDYDVSLTDRTQYSVDKNATGDCAAYDSGCTVLAAKDGYKQELADEEQKLACNILNELSALGIENQGILLRDSEANEKYENGELADYYAIIRGGVLKDIPTVLVEHAFVDDDSDFENYLSSDAKLKVLSMETANIIKLVIKRIIHLQKKKPKRTPLIRTLQLQKPKNRSRLQKSLLQRRKRMLALNQKVRKKVQKNPQIHPKTLPPNL